MTKEDQTKRASAEACINEVFQMLRERYDGNLQTSVETRLSKIVEKHFELDENDEKYKRLISTCVKKVKLVENEIEKNAAMSKTASAIEARVQDLADNFADTYNRLTKSKTSESSTQVPTVSKAPKTKLELGDVLYVTVVDPVVRPFLDLFNYLRVQITEREIRNVANNYFKSKPIKVQNEGQSMV